MSDLADERNAWEHRHWVDAHRRMTEAITRFLDRRYKVSVTHTDDGLRVERDGATIIALAVVSHRLMAGKTQLGSQQRSHILEKARRLAMIPAPRHLLIVADDRMKKAAASELDVSPSLAVCSTGDLVDGVLQL